MFLSVLTLSSIFVQADKYTKDTHEICKGNICTTTIYAQPKYIEINKKWEEVVEKLGSNCQKGYDYCSDKDKTYMQVYLNNTLSEMAIESEEKSFTSFLKSIIYNGEIINLKDNKNLKNVTIIENRIIYAIDNFDYEIYYTPTSIKDMLTIHNTSKIKSDLILNYEVSKNYNISVKGDQQGYVNLGEVLMWDETFLETGNIKLITKDTGTFKDNLQAVIDIGNFTLKNPTKYIDPAFIFTRQSQNDGDVLRRITGFPPYVVSTTGFFNVGPINNCPPGLSNPRIFRGFVEWNLSGIDQGSNTIAMSMNLTARAIVNGNISGNLTFRNMEHDQSYYELNDPSNMSIYEDAGNGTFYNNFTFTTSNLLVPVEIEFNESVFSSLNEMFGNATNFFSVGLRNANENINCTYGRIVLTPEDAANPINRPFLKVTYEKATDEGNIEVGFNNSSGSFISFNYSQVCLNEVPWIRFGNSTGNLSIGYLLSKYYVEINETHQEEVCIRKLPYIFIQ